MSCKLSSGADRCSYKIRPSHVTTSTFKIKIDNRFVQQVDHNVEKNSDCGTTRLAGLIRFVSGACQQRGSLLPEDIASCGTCQQGGHLRSEDAARQGGRAHFLATRVSKEAILSLKTSLPMTRGTGPRSARPAFAVSPSCWIS